MNPTSHERRSQARDQLIRLLEHAFVEIVSPPRPDLIVRSSLVIDIRSRWFEAFVFSTGQDGRLRVVPREIMVEEADQVVTSRRRIPIAAYRRPSNQTWTICSPERLKHLRSHNQLDYVDNLVGLSEQSEGTRSMDSFDRLLFAFLKPLQDGSSIGSFDEIVIVVDQDSARERIAASLIKLAPRIDKSRPTLWRSAEIITVRSDEGIQGYVFLNSIKELSRIEGNYLLLTGPDNAISLRRRDGLNLHHVVKGNVDIEQFDAVIAVGPKDGKFTRGRVSTIENTDALRVLALAGYLAWCQQIDEGQLAEMRSRLNNADARLKRALDRKASLQALVLRARTLLLGMNGKKE